MGRQWCDSLIAKNPAKGVKLPKIASSRLDATRVLGIGDVVHLAEAIEPRYRAMVILAAGTGLRFGEVAALRTTSIDMLRRKLQVTETLRDINGSIDFGPPKTRKSRRVVTMPQFVINDLASHLASYGDGDGGLIFTDTLGGPIRPSNFRRRIWHPAVEASVGPPLRFHDLRHSHAAVPISEGVHPKTISERLGHESITITMDIYGDLLPGVEEAAADSIDAAYNRGVLVGLAAEETSAGSRHRR